MTDSALRLIFQIWLIKPFFGAWQLYVFPPRDVIPQLQRALIQQIGLIESRIRLEECMVKCSSFRLFLRRLDRGLRQRTLLNQVLLTLRPFQTLESLKCSGSLIRWQYHLYVGEIQDKQTCPVSSCEILSVYCFFFRQWISFFSGASTAAYVYIYSVYYFLFKTKSVTSRLIYFSSSANLTKSPLVQFLECLAFSRQPSISVTWPSSALHWVACVVSSY